MLISKMKALRLLLLCGVLVQSSLAINFKFWQWFNKDPPLPSPLNALKAMDKAAFQKSLDQIDDYLSNIGDKVDLIDGKADQMRTEGVELVSIIRQIIEYNEKIYHTSVPSLNNTTNSTSSNASNSTRKSRRVLTEGVTTSTNLSMAQKVARSFMKLYEAFDTKLPASESTRSRNNATISSTLETPTVRHMTSAHMASEAGEEDIKRWGEGFNDNDNTPKTAETLLKKTVEIRGYGQKIIEVLRPIPEG